MIVIEIFAALLMLACIGQAGRYAWRRERQLILPIGLYLTVALMLGFAAFGGESHLITDTETMIARGLAAVVLLGLAGGYFLLIRKARAKAAQRDGQ
ncbi:MAG: hypothetical protein AAF416_04140 [Pseudomonadota bacterium]